MTKYLLFYVKKNSPYFWKLQLENDKFPIGHFKNRRDALNFFIANKFEGQILFQDNNSIFVGGIVTKKENDIIKYQIKIAYLPEILTLEDKEIYKSNLANEFQINLITEVDALSKEDRNKNYQNSFIVYNEKLH